MRLRRPVQALVLVCATISLDGAQASPDALHRQTRRIMGTSCEIQVYHADARVAEQAISAALDEMQRVDRLLSSYDKASELSAMNREAARAPFRASDELFGFVKRCRDYFTQTAGAFDPTVGPLVRAWGFFTPTPAKPPDDQIAAAKARSGFDKIRLDEAARTVSYVAEELEFDPGGIGKGYAVDMAVRSLRQSGIASALVSAGGSSTYAIGHPPGRDAWRLAVGNPSRFDRPLRYVRLRDAAVSTSGVSERFVRLGGRWLSHIFDPRTGEPVEGMCQASVVAPTGTDSDALTKAAFILSREAATRLFEREKQVHVLRVEGLCGPEEQVWLTPWSSDVFEEQPERPPR